MIRTAIWLSIIAGLLFCRWVGIGDGSVLNDSYWAGYALAVHWWWTR